MGDLASLAVDVGVGKPASGDDSGATAAGDLVMGALVAVGIGGGRPVSGDDGGGTAAAAFVAERIGGGRPVSGDDGGRTAAAASAGGGEATCAAVLAGTRTPS